MFWVVQESAIEGRHVCEVLHCAESEEEAKELLEEGRTIIKTTRANFDWVTIGNTEYSFSIGNPIDYKNNHISQFVLNGHKNMPGENNDVINGGVFWVLVEYRLQEDGVDAYNNIVILSTEELESAKAILVRYARDEREMARERGMTIVQDSDLVFYACTTREAEKNHTAVYIVSGTGVVEKKAEG